MTTNILANIDEQKRTQQVENGHQRSRLLPLTIFACFY